MYIYMYMYMYMYIYMYINSYVGVKVTLFTIFSYLKVTVDVMVTNWCHLNENVKVTCHYFLP